MLILNDFSTTVKKALEEIDPQYMEYPGLVVCGTHTPHEIGLIKNYIREARISGTPFLGICFGHQLAAIEYAQNVLDIKDATSEEFGQGTLIVKKLPELHVGLHGGETYWNNYAVIDGFEDLWKKADNFITCQYHPEYQSSIDKPHPLLVKFIEQCKRIGSVE